METPDRSQYFAAYRLRTAGKRKQYYRDNRVRILAMVKARYESKSEDIKKYLRDYYRKNKARLCAAAMEYERTHPDMARSKRRKFNQSERGQVISRSARAKRRALEHGASIMVCEREEIRFLYGLSRALSKGGCKHHVDHVIPLSKGALTAH